MVLDTNRGSIIKYGVVNETPFTVKLQSITLPNGTYKQRASSVWATHPPDDSKFQINSDDKLE